MWQPYLLYFFIWFRSRVPFTSKVFKCIQKNLEKKLYLFKCLELYSKSIESNMISVQRLKFLSLFLSVWCFYDTAAHCRNRRRRLGCFLQGEGSYNCLVVAIFFQHNN